MRKSVLVLGAMAALATPVLAADDPIATREAMMRSNGSSGAVAGAMLKGDVAYDPMVAKAILSSFNAVAVAFGEFFPEGSEQADPTGWSASPKIWEDRAGFDAELVKFQTATGEAVTASGRDGPPDLEAFGAAVSPVFDSCTSCHKGYQIEN